MSTDACVICLKGVPNDVVAELDGSWVTVPEFAPLKGYACLVFRRHAVELHDLSEHEGATFMRDVQRLSRVLKRITGATKLNYEVHGNTIEHLHMHFYPRRVDDVFQGRPISPKEVTTPVYGVGELEDFRSVLRGALGL